jgi:hypothetical protein
MPTSPKDAYDRLTRAVTAWQTLRPQKTFAGMTLDQFRSSIAPSFTARVNMARLENELNAAQNQRDDADLVSNDNLLLVINAIKGDPAEGEDGELYEAFGYVRKSERKSGLSRKGSALATSGAKA